MGKTYFNPGCALTIHKPEAEVALLKLLRDKYDGNVELHSLCCHHDPQVEKGSCIVVVCAGCDRRFNKLYEGISTLTLWEVLDGVEGIQYPDYKGRKMSLHDPCPIRSKPQVHRAARSLLKKMNIEVVEAALHAASSRCCGDSYYPDLPLEEIHARMKERAASMPCDEVAVYCVTCVRSMHFGGKKPRYLVDLLLGEETVPPEGDVPEWHARIKEYRERH